MINHIINEEDTHNCQEKKFNYKLIITYEGNSFHGWQINPHQITVQQILEDILKKIHGQFIRIIGASRTDAGVHSYGQTAHFYGEKLWNPDELKKSLNFYLKQWPIVISKAYLVDCNFHSRYLAQGKIYHYQIYLDEIIDPFKKKYWWLWHKNIDEVKLKKVCDLIKNCKNLNGFAHWKTELLKPYNLYDLQYDLNGQTLTLKFYGKGFFYNEIRYLVGHIIYYSSNIMDEINCFLPLENPNPSDYKKILAPAHGLFLMEVLY